MYVLPHITIQKKNEEYLLTVPCGIIVALWGAKALFVAFADVCGVNVSPMADFKLLI